MIQNRWSGVIICSLLGSLGVGCGAEPGELESSTSDTYDISASFCRKSEPKDVIIAQLVKDSLVKGYPLTQLEVTESGTVTGSALPPELQGTLDLINSVPEARDAVAKATAEIADLPDYAIASVSPEYNACPAVAAWTPTGQTVTSTTTVQVVASTNEESWHATHRAYSKVSSLLKRFGNKDLVDPPGDGSTNLPPSNTVSSTGVIANPYGFCPTGTTPGTFCKLSYATGVNFMGRKCQYYYGYLRCLLY